MNHSTALGLYSKILEVTIASEVLPYSIQLRIELTYLAQCAIECESIVLVCITFIYQVQHLSMIHFKVL